jgi:hypothetical protein
MGGADPDARLDIDLSCRPGRIDGNGERDDHAAAIHSAGNAADAALKTRRRRRNE